MNSVIIVEENTLTRDDINAYIEQNLVFDILRDDGEDTSIDPVE